MYLNTIKTVISNNLPILIIFTITMIALRVAYLREHRNKLVFYKEFFYILSIVYIFLLFQLLTKVELNSGSGYNLVPFQEIFRYEIGTKLFYFNVVGNIVSFVIFGLIVAYYVRPKNIISPFIISLLVSFTVEFVQLNIGRTFDVDDIILNVLGGIIGYLLYVGLCAIHRHLPNILKSDTVLNIISFILFVLLVLYLFKIMGVVNICMIIR